jgi:hypothetical protein
MALACVIATASGALLLTGRLLLLARRTRALPELLIALVCLFSGCGLSSAAALAVWPLEPDWLQLPLLAASRVSFHIGCAFVALSTWRIFRPVGLWPLVLVCALFLPLGGLAVNDVVLVRTDAVRRSTPIFWAGYLAQCLCFCWSAWEALRHHSMLRRRIPLGLAEPEVARRILLWGIGALVCGAGLSVWMVATWFDPGFPRQPWAIAIGMSLTLTAVSCMWGIFFGSATAEQLDPARTERGK